MNRSPKPDASATDLTPVLERNILALIAQRKKVDSEKPLAVRIADAVSRFAGSMRFVAIHLVLFGGWIIWNLKWMPLPKFDPTYVILAMWASVEAIFLSTFVLITQNRLAALADKRADLDLQISLLSEHEITRLLHLVTAVGAKLGVEEAGDPALDHLKKDVQPEQVLERLESAGK